MTRFELFCICNLLLFFLIEKYPYLPNGPFHLEYVYIHRNRGSALLAEVALPVPDILIN